MHLIVTGHTGTIGRHFSSDCTKSNIDLLKLPQTMGAKAQYLNSTIIHLAGIVGPSNVEAKRAESYKVNVTKTIEFAEKSLESGISKFVFASTSHVYAKSFEMISEEDPIEPQNHYAEQKAEAETTLSQLFLNTTAQLTIVRIFSVLDWECRDFTLGGLFRKIAAGDKTSMIRNGDDERDFLTPKSIAKYLELIALSEGMSGVWNLSSGHPVTVREAAIKMLYNVIGESINERILEGMSQSPRIVGNNQKVRNAFPEEDFNWSPTEYKAAF